MSLEIFVTAIFRAVYPATGKYTSISDIDIEHIRKDRTLVIYD